jgi:hypothetical protein
MNILFMKFLITFTSLTVITCTVPSAVKRFWSTDFCQRSILMIHITLTINTDYCPQQHWLLIAEAGVRSGHSPRETCSGQSCNASTFVCQYRPPLVILTYILIISIYTGGWRLETFKQGSVPSNIWKQWTHKQFYICSQFSKGEKVKQSRYGPGVAQRVPES